MSAEKFFQKYGELLAGAYAAVLAAIYLAAATTIPKSSFMKIGADFMPYIYGTIMAILGILQIIQGFRSLKTWTSDENGAVPEVKVDNMNVLLTLVLIFAYIGSMDFLGFVLSSTIYFIIQCALLTPSYAKRRYIVYAISGFALSMAGYLVFHNVLDLALPSGAIFG